MTGPLHGARLKLPGCWLQVLHQVERELSGCWTDRPSHRSSLAVNPSLVATGAPPGGEGIV